MLMLMLMKSNLCEPYYEEGTEHCLAQEEECDCKCNPNS